MSGVTFEISDHERLLIVAEGKNRNEVHIFPNGETLPLGQSAASIVGDGRGGQDEKGQ